MLDRVDQLLGPQREALATTFRVRAGPAPDRFFVGPAALSLLSEVAENDHFLLSPQVASLDPPREHDLLCG